MIAPFLFAPFNTVLHPPSPHPHLISTPLRTAYEWVNPAAYGLVVVTSSEGRNLPYGRLEDILSRDSSALNCHTNDDKNAWFAVDLGLWVIPSAYTLRHAR